ncbi:hypothetical protein Q1695_009444 [Nippostrongylus brasiliensis]|nr:hypothetical protein Q1695_009444 [Nippostrongylus brasiliensis]
MSGSQSIFQQPPPPPLWSLYSARCHMMLMLGAISVTFGMIHGSISMTIVCMVASPRNNEAKTINVDLRKSEVEANYSRAHGITWTIEQQSFIHTGFYLGSLISTVTSHYLTGRFRAKRVLSCSLLLCGVGSILTPLAVILGSSWSVAIMRVCIGLGNGMLLPCGTTIVRKWFTETERATAMQVFPTGSNIGLCFSMIFTPLQCQLKLIGGWPLALEIYGLCALIALIIWELRAANKPRHSSYVTASELEHIRSKRRRRTTSSYATATIPLMKIIRSRCIFAICLCNYTQWFITSAVIAYLPIFFHNVARESLLQSALYSGLPLFVALVCKVSFRTTGWFMMNRGITTTTTVRILTSIAVFGAVPAILGLALVREYEAAIVAVLLSVVLGFLSIFSVVSDKCVTVIMPQFTPVVRLYTDLYCQLAGIMSPILIVLLLSKDVHRNTILSLLATLVICTGIVFIVFANGHREVCVDYASGQRLVLEHVADPGNDRSEERICSTQTQLESSRRPLSRDYPKAVNLSEAETITPLNHCKQSKFDFDDEFTSDDEY